VACRDTFGVQVLYIPSQADSFSFTAVFDAAHEAVDMDASGVAFSTVQPVLSVRLADLQVAPTQGDRVKINCGKYQVVDVQTDGHGGARLILRRQ